MYPVISRCNNPLANLQQVLSTPKMSAVSTLQFNRIEIGREFFFHLVNIFEVSKIISDQLYLIMPSQHNNLF